MLGLWLVPKMCHKPLFVCGASPRHSHRHPIKIYLRGSYLCLVCQGGDLLSWRAARIATNLAQPQDRYLHHKVSKAPSVPLLSYPSNLPVLHPPPKIPHVFRTPTSNPAVLQGSDPRPNVSKAPASPHWFTSISQPFRSACTLPNPINNMLPRPHPSAFYKRSTPHNDPHFIVTQLLLASPHTLILSAMKKVSNDNLSLCSVPCPMC